MSVYVSVTGLTVRSPLQTPYFWWLATQSFGQAQNAEGNVNVDARTVKGVHHTLSVWTSREAMLAYLRQGAHKHAMKAYRLVGTGKVYGYEADAPPSWDIALTLWEAHGRVV